MVDAHWERLMPKEQEFYIWEGVYKEWNEAPETKENAFNSTKWLDDLVIQAKASLGDFQKCDEEISGNAKSRDNILSVVVSMLNKEVCPIKVLDFGGGLGSSYFSVLESLHTNKDLEFHIVEGQRICEMAKELFPNNMGLYFHNELPKDSGGFDIVHAARSFQYVDDWRGLLSSFARLEPRYLILAGALAGDIDPFVSIQNYYGYKISVRFLNLQELIDEAEKHGFKLIHKSLHVSKRLGKEGVLPMGNFPEKFQLEYPCQLLFEFNL